MAHPTRPTNHVTEALRLLRDGTRAPPMPEVDPRFLAWLITTLPPRCYRPGQETLEDHLKYAGKVELVEAIRMEHERRLAEVVPEDDDEIAALAMEGT